MADENVESTSSENSDEEILRVARERFKLAQEAYADAHKVAREDDNFSVGNQWPEEIRIAREKEARPCLVVNKIAPSINQVTNDQKQNSPSITYSPVDDNADVDTAKIYQGLNRHIQRNSNAEGVYDWAFGGAVRHGFGFYRITTDYVSPTSFNQEILFKKVADHYSVLLDPHHNEVDGSDAKWGFVVDRMSKDDFKAQFGEAKLCEPGGWETAASSYPDWVDTSSVVVAEYFYTDYKKEKLLLLSNEQAVLESEFKKLQDEGLAPENLEIIDERETTTATIKWCKITGDEILDKADWPSQWIPLIPVYGNIVMVNGKKVFESLPRYAKDPQRMLNLWVSSETETIAAAPKSPYIGEAAAFEGYGALWQTANTKSHAYLPYNGKDSEGNPIAPPQRNVYEAPVQAITNARMQASDDIKATTGIYDAALGNRSNENSGIAIQKRANQSQTGNYHFVDNLNASIKHGGRIVAQLIPVIYDTPRTERILGENGEVELVKINQEFNDNGTPRTYDLSRGKYDVDIDTGPNYATKRQETAASMLEISKSVPAIMQAAPDLMIKNMDWPGATEIAERMKKTLPPGLVDDKNQQPLPPQVQAQMAQMQQMIQMLTVKLTDANQTIATKRTELESKERIAFAQMEVDLKKELLKAQAPTSQAIAMAEIAEIQNRENILGINEPFPSPQNFNGMTPDQSAPVQQQPTGGQPGQIMGV